MKYRIKNIDGIIGVYSAITWWNNTDSISPNLTLKYDRLDDEIAISLNKENIRKEDRTLFKSYVRDYKLKVLINE